MANSLKRSQPADLRVAVVGLGPIGTEVIKALDRGIDGLVLVAVSVQNPGKHRALLAGLKKMPTVLPIAALCEIADIVIECAPAGLLRSIVAPFVRNGKTAIVLSAGALLENEDLVELAKSHGGQIVVPTGALIGLDAVAAAAAGNIHSVRMVTRKPVQGLAGAPYIVETTSTSSELPNRSRYSTAPRARRQKDSRQTSMLPLRFRLPAWERIEQGWKSGPIQR